MIPDVSDDQPTRRRWLGFWSMILQQTQNAFSDKLAQFTLIPLGGAIGYSILLPVGAGIEVDVVSAIGLLMALPMVLFAPVAGWLSDRFSKRDVMLGASIVQGLVLGGICVAVMLRNMPLALCGAFGLAVQSAFFSPAKIGINKELVGSKYLGFAAGIQQMTAMLAILAGQIFAGWLFDHRFHGHGGLPAAAWSVALNPLLLLAVLSVPALLFACLVPRVPAQGGPPFSGKRVVSHFLNLADLWRDRPLRSASFGVAFFWGFAAFINLWSVKLAKQMTGGGEGNGTQASIFMASASLGMAAGFGCSSFLMRRRIELGWVPLAGCAMTASALALAAMTPGSAGFLVTLALLAFFAAVFLAPLTAWMQDRYPAAKRGELQAAVNLQDCIAGIIAVIVIGGLEYATRAFQIPRENVFRYEIGVIGVVCGAVTLSIIRRLPGDFIRLVGGAVVRWFYRIRVLGLEQVPKTGGALLLPNHVTFADAFFISAASPRPVRFVMDQAFMASPAIRVFVSIFDTMTIRRDQPLEAIRAMITALKNGDLVCLFPEGQLTRTGTLSELRRGFELTAKKAGHPLIPLWCDGSWGSVFSFERGRFIRKIPRKIPGGLSLAFGPPIDPKSASLPVVRDALLAASAAAIGNRFKAAGWLTRIPAGPPAAVARFRSLSREERRAVWINGHQIGQIHALDRRGTFHMLAADPLAAALPGISLTFPALFGAKLVLAESPESGVWVGGDLLRAALENAAPFGKVVFYDFSATATVPLVHPNILHLPCLAMDGRVIAMSMPHPPAAEGEDVQPGSRPDSWGRLIPGWCLQGHTLVGPAAVAPIAAPAMTLDPAGFITRE